MKFAQKLAIGALALTMGASAMAAENKGADALTNAEEGALNICDVVSEGIFNISAMHQSNISEAEAKKTMDEVAADLIKQHGNDEVTAFVKEFWQDSLSTIIYKQPIQTADDKKREIVQANAVESGLACLGILLGEKEAEQALKKIQPGQK
ncbi:hypothetical protein AAX09_04005 [Moraxella bovoculi]|uniref:hypothetical protein n=1 Tax=Moraxella bovoculi TaxID=386891 RepID=UPI00062474C7|nr:hypothetical protein [Moraxella bovoculi]AKG16940.1 hypothetical protein AAX10_03940 [Moraxella bovoculi]AKG18684.1 hypothetical protein AAX09_04005 [Moraxella bovoculi]